MCNLILGTFYSWIEQRYAGWSRPGLDSVSPQASDHVTGHPTLFDSFVCWTVDLVELCGLWTYVDGVCGLCMVLVDICWLLWVDVTFVDIYVIYIAYLSCYYNFLWFCCLLWLDMHWNKQKKLCGHILPSVALGKTEILSVLPSVALGKTANRTKLVLILWILPSVPFFTECRVPTRKYLTTFYRVWTLGKHYFPKFICGIVLIKKLVILLPSVRSYTR